MKEIMQKFKNKKGFTLVELIVVLVILAILAALLIPTLTGYIDKANEMKAESACRMVVMATKAEMGDLYGKVPAGSDLKDASIDADKLEAAIGTAANKSGAMYLAEIPAGAKVTIDATVDANGVVTKLVYTNTSYECTYENSVFNVVKKTTAITNGSFKISVTGGATKTVSPLA